MNKMYTKLIGFSISLNAVFVDGVTEQREIVMMFCYYVENEKLCMTFWSLLCMYRILRS